MEFRAYLVQPLDKTVNSHLPEGLLGSTEGAYNSTSGFADSILKNYRFGSKADLPFGRHTVTVGAEAGRSVLDDSLSMTATARAYGQIPWLAAKGRSGKASQNNYALYAEDNIALNDGKTYLTPGLRWDYNTAFGSVFSPSFNFSHAVNGNWKIKGGIARAFKAPNLYQTQENYLLINASNGCPIDSHNHWNNPNAQNATSGSGTAADPYKNSNAGGFDWGRACYFLGNRNIKPETSLNKEIGVEFKKDGYLASLAFFHNNYKNRIVDEGNYVGTVNGPANGYDREIRSDNTPSGPPRLPQLHHHPRLPLGQWRQRGTRRPGRQRHPAARARQAHLVHQLHLHEPQQRKTPRQPGFHRAQIHHQQHA